MHTCNCTNQCPGCGSCCQIDCGCRRRGFRAWPQPQTAPMPITIPVSAPAPMTTGEIRIVPQYPLTAEDVRKIVREALAEALDELRELKEGDDA